MPPLKVYGNLKGGILGSMFYYLNISYWAFCAQNMERFSLKKVILACDFLLEFPT